MPNHIRGVPSRFVQAVRDLDQVFFMREEVAAMLDVAPTTLKAWGEADEEVGPYGYLDIENRKVYLYRPEDVAALREYQLARYPIRKNGQRARRRGRPKLWDPAELEDRRQRWRRVAYLKQRAAKFEREEAENRQLDALAEAETMSRQLRAEYEERFALVTEPREHTEDWLATQMQFDSVS